MNTFVSVLSTLIFAFLPAPVTLYDSAGNAIVTLPQTYFVAVMESSDGLTYVNYNDLDGYVKSDEIEIVDYEPVTKYETTVRFYADNDLGTINLRSTPDHTKSTNIIRTLPSNAEGYCYGSINGTSLISQVGPLWYYVRVDGNVRGYVYSSQVIVDPTPENEIEKVVVASPDDNDDLTKAENPINVLGNVRTIIFIIALTVPAVFLMYLLFKKPKDNTKADR